MDPLFEKGSAMGWISAASNSTAAGPFTNQRNRHVMTEKGCACLRNELAMRSELELKCKNAYQEALNEVREGMKTPTKAHAWGDKTDRHEHSAAEISSKLTYGNYR